MSTIIKTYIYTSEDGDTVKVQYNWLPPSVPNNMIYNSKTFSFPKEVTEETEVGY